MSEIQLQIRAKSSLPLVYQALSQTSGLSAWWTKAVGEIGLGSEITFYFGEKPGPRVEVIALEADRHFAWRFKAGPEEWVGTEVHFAISEEKGKVQIDFRHTGWKTTAGLFSHCNMKWAVFLLSLKEYLESGHGRPFPNDIQIN